MAIDRQPGVSGPGFSRMIGGELSCGFARRAMWVRRMDQPGRIVRLICAFAAMRFWLPLGLLFLSAELRVWPRLGQRLEYSEKAGGLFRRGRFERIGVEGRT